MLVIEKKYSGGDFYLPLLFRIGQSGVDLFFVISGFIMITITQKAGKENNPVDFLIHRFARIYPNYWFYFFITFAIFLVQPSLVNASQGNHFDFFRSLFLIPAVTLPLVLIAWSLIYELYFYLVFALLIAIKRWAFTIALFLWLALLLIINLFSNPAHEPILKLVTNPYPIEFILGAFSAIIISKPFIKKIPATAFFILAAAVVIALPFLFSHFYATDGIHGLLAQTLVFGLAYSLLVIAFVAIEQIARKNFPAFLVKLGDISYTIYLSHLLILGAIGRIWSLYFQHPDSAWDNLIVFPLMLVCIIVYSLIAYRLIEKPSYSFFVKLAYAIKKKDLIVADAKNNNFNPIRIYLSLSVLFFHVFELSHKPSLSFINKIFDGGRAVDAFFIISGYLIMKSYARSRSVREYFIKRIRRIYPAYLTIIVLCALLGFLVSSYSIKEYFLSPDLYKYVLSNLVFLNFIYPTLPGVFQSNFFQVVNGSLWSLKVEVGFYILVPLIVYLKSKIKFPLLYGCLFLLSAGYFFGMMHLYHTTHSETYLILSRQTPGELLFFITGAAFAEIDAYPQFAKWLGWLGIPATIALFLPLGMIPGALAQALAVFFFAFIIPPLQYPFKREDFSYGIYICHFPVIQILVQYGWFNRSPFLGLAASLFITFILAALSWFFIEKPFIVRKMPMKMKMAGELVSNDRG